MLNYEKLKTYAFPDTVMELTRRDTILYALGVGLGDNPTDAQQLRFLYEKDLQALPTMATIIAAPHAVLKKADVGSSGRSVHAGISFTLHRNIPVEGSFRCRTSLGEVVDKGEGKAALVTTVRRVYEVATDELVFEIHSTSMLRGDGGFNGPTESTAPVHKAPGRAPDSTIEMATLPQSALIYRLSGDYNPLHCDPEVAEKSGFPRPILHGLCTYGVTGHALLKACCDYDPARLTSMSARFSKPVYPGDTLEVRIWREPQGICFQTTVPAREDEVVLDFGLAAVT